MSALSRFGPAVARSLVAHQQRQMASASVASDPIQKLFVEKIREIKTSNKGLDPTHEKQLKDEMLRLKRVYSVDDENKLAHLEHKFENECDVSLHDLDSSKEMRMSIQKGEYQNQLAAQTSRRSDVLATIPDQTRHEMSLPPMNHPDALYMYENAVPAPSATKLGESSPDYTITDYDVTPEKLEREMLVHFGDQMPTIQDDGPQRDKVNFPRQPPILNTPPTRFHIIPESWFQFFYPKTGVTGPYAFAAAFGTFLMSKEWLVMEHELLTGITSTGIFAYGITKYGPKAREYVIGLANKSYDGWDNWQKENIQTLSTIIDQYKKQSNFEETIDELYNARKQDVELQLESEYRRRLKTIHEDTKRRLNYLVAVNDSQRQIFHSNMVNMVLTNVKSAFGPKQESEVLENCVINLKSLASKHANTI